MLAILPLTQEFLPGAADVLAGTLGKGYVTKDHLSAYLRTEEEVQVQAPAHLGLVAVDDEKQVLGVVTATIMDDFYDMLEYVPADKRERFASLVSKHATVPASDAGGKVAMVHSVGVHPDSQGHGVGTSLVESILTWLRQSEVGMVSVIGWTDRTGCHIEKLLTRTGFRIRGDIPRFWTVDSISRGYSCPTCGRPCLCTARVFVRTVWN